MKNLRNKILATILTGTIAITGVISGTTVYASEPAPSNTEETTSLTDTLKQEALTENINTNDNSSTIEDISNIEDVVIAAPIEDALEANAVTDIVTTTTDTDSATYPTQDTYIVVLDPGHGAPGTGTYRDYGDFVIDEAVINLKISQYTKAALEENYNNITVYMTKTTQNENPSLADRVAFAVGKNADLFVSQHVNSTSAEQTTANGVMAMVPTVDSSHAYNQDAALLSQKLARKVLNQLVSLGFKDNGFLFELSKDNTQYPDGSLADYYGIVRHCRLNNLPGTIIEHGFANNESDALKLKNEEMLKQIGEADARGIVEYLVEHEGYVASGGSEDGDEPDYPPTDNPANPFKDVSETEYYYDAVLWAVENGITYGISETFFGVEQACTRAQGFSFLWRNQGSPASDIKNILFEDVSPTDYYYNAICWGVENNIASGYSATEFGPDDALTRAQFVSFLWRAFGRPEPVISSNPFTDVSEDDYYYDAVLWAVENGITAGTSATTFSPNDTCLRVQVVSFLFRASGI